jgi:hypothetical protein
MTTQTSSTPATDGLASTIQRYFDLMYDCDVSRFDEVFHPTAQLHGVVAGKLTFWPAQTYREVLASRTPPSRANAPRFEKVLMQDMASDDQALVKVRVLIHDREFVDHLCLLRIDGDWRITAKTFHLDREGATA